MTIANDFPDDVAKTKRFEELREAHYDYLDQQGQIYLDYAGSGLPSRAQLEDHATRLAAATLGNPHSINPTSQNASQWVDRTRLRILKHFNASPEEYAVIFTANATNAARLVGESYPFGRRSRLVLTADNHNSINGLRQFARHAHAKTRVVPFHDKELRISSDSVEKALSKRTRCIVSSSCRSLFAYPAQSNFSGAQHPLSWIRLAHDRGYDVLLDAAAYVATNALDLSCFKPDFVTISWYKLFGLPTGVGSLIARRCSLARLNRPWFSGGTVQAVTVGIPWHSLMADETAFEDGTLNFLSIPDINFGLDWLAGIGLRSIGKHMKQLIALFLNRLIQLRHSNGEPMIVIYGPKGLEVRGPTVTFNVIDEEGKLVDDRITAIESASAGISLRTGCFCNPGAGEAAFGLDKGIVQALIRARRRSSKEFQNTLASHSVGAIRISFGIPTLVDDVKFAVDWLEKTYKDRVTSTKGLDPKHGC